MQNIHKVIEMEMTTQVELKEDQELKPREQNTLHVKLQSGCNRDSAEMKTDHHNDY